MAPRTRDLVSDQQAERKPNRFLLYLAFAGPGLIAASAGNDAGGVVTYASAGAQFGYRTLFYLMVHRDGLLRGDSGNGGPALSCTPARVSPRSSARNSRCGSPPSPSSPSSIANLGLMVTEYGGIAAAFSLFGVSRYLCVPIAAVVIWALVLFGSYRYAERIFLLMTLVFIAYPIAVVLGHPDWHQVVPQHAVAALHLRAQGFLLLGVALIGTTVTPYIQLYEAGAVVDKGVQISQYRYQRVDAIGGAIISDIVSMTIIIATAAAIGGSGLSTEAAEAAHALEPVAGPAAVALFGIGLLGASALAAAVVPLGGRVGPRSPR